MAKNNIFDWEYCECGCKSYECVVAGITYSLYWDLKNGWYLDGTKFKSKASAEKFILKTLAKHKQGLIKQKNSINKILRALKDKGM